MTMIIYLFRIFIAIALLIFVYTAHQYYHNPQRKLRKAKRNRTFFLLDDSRNTKQNIQLVYKGCAFEGEKYVGTTEKSFDVVNINMIVHDPLELIGFTRDDLDYLEREIHKAYPNAHVKWKHPINRLLENKRKDSSIN